ncbi:M28 family metallopeptidase [Bacillus carboniphilus]
MASNAARIKNDLKYLCSTQLQGRLSGSTGAKRAATFLAGELEKYGFIPAGKEGYFESVSVPAARLLGEATLSIGKWNLLHRIEFGELAYYGGGSGEGRLVVLKEGSEYDESVLEGSFVLLRGDTTDMDLKETVRSANQMGVKAILMDGGEPRWFHKSVMGDYRTTEQNIPVIKIRTSLLSEIEALEGQMVKLNLPIETGIMECQNVMGYLPGQDAEGKTIAFATHYDFLGDDPSGFRFEGAGDNAAGVATMLELARKLSEQRLPLNILIVFTTGEESNLWGEKHFVSNPPLQLDQTIYLDALGRSPYYSLNLVYDESERYSFAEAFTSQCYKDGIKTNITSNQKHLFDLLITGTSGVKFRPYHTPDDTWKLIHVEVLEEVANALYSSCKRIK